MRRFCFYIFIFLMVSGCIDAGDGYTPDSSMSSQDSSKLQSYLERSHSNIDFVEGVAFAQLLRDHANAERNVDDEIRSLHVLFELHFNNGKNDMALNVCQRAMDLNPSTQNEFLKARTYHYMGKYLARMHNPTLSSRNLSTSFKSFLAIGDTLNVAAVFRDFVKCYNQNSIFDSAYLSINRSFMFDSLLSYAPGLAEDNALMGDIYLSRFKANFVDPVLPLLDTAKIYFDKAVTLNSHLPSNDINVEEVVSIGYTELYYCMLKFSPNVDKRALADSSLKYHKISERYVRNLEDGEVRKRFDLLKFSLLLLIGDSEASRRFNDSIAEIASRTKATYLDKEICYRIKSLVYEKNGDYLNCLKCREMADMCQKTSEALNSSLATTVSIARGQYEGETFRNIAMKKQMEGEARALRGRIVSLALVAFLLLILGIVVFRNLRKTKKLNKHINEINGKLEDANKLITQRSKEITESISYASIIQKAAMPSHNELFDIFGENLVLLRPRDIVSGDFFWASETGPYKLLVAGDCTGHGVPGALLSMLGMSILDYVTLHFGMKNISAGLVLDRMRSYFKRTLNQSSFRTDMAMDSIDLALIVVDTQARQLHYAAAFRPLIYFRNGELFKVKADPMPIGVYPKERDHFANHVIDLMPGDVFYIFSDGIPDQSGYEDAKSDMARAYSNKRFLSLLQEIHRLPFQEQKSKIVDAIENWMESKDSTQSKIEQTDDNVIVGISVDNFVNF